MASWMHSGFYQINSGEGNWGHLLRYYSGEHWRGQQKKKNESLEISSEDYCREPKGLGVMFSDAGISENVMLKAALLVPLGHLAWTVHISPSISQSCRFFSMSSVLALVRYISQLQSPSNISLSPASPLHLYLCPNPVFFCSDTWLISKQCLHHTASLLTDLHSISRTNLKKSLAVKDFCHFLMLEILNYFLVIPWQEFTLSPHCLRIILPSVSLPGSS